MLLMVKMDLAPSETPREAKNSKLDNCNLEFHKFMPDFFKILQNIHCFPSEIDASLDYTFYLLLTMINIKNHIIR